MKNTDTLHVVISDMHSGSIHALTVGRIWKGQKTSDIHPNSQQVAIRKQWLKFMGDVKLHRKGRKVRLIINGDSLEGIHHSSNDTFTMDELEMAEIAVELIEEFKRGIAWQRGDEAYVMRGTTVHVKSLENYIGREVNAVPCGDFYVHNRLLLDTNGVQSVTVHTGPNVGKGQNEGNSLRNFMNNYYVSAMKDGERTPDIFYFAHVHNPYYAVIEQREKDMNFRTLHGIITPSWQMKTTYALDKMPHSKNRIGGVMQLITADGLIGTPVFSVLEA